MASDPYERHRRQLATLATTLRAAVDADPEQEVGDFARPVVDAVIKDVKATLKGDPVVDASAEVVSPEMAIAELPWRALDVLLVVDQLLAVVPQAQRPRPVISPPIGHDPWTEKY